jgi:hypothetical protein
LTYLLAVGLIAGSLLLLVGCGGGGEQNGQSKGSTAEQTAQKAASHTFKGTVTGVGPQPHILTVKRNNGKAKIFKYKPVKVHVRLDGKQAGPEAIKKGQYVRVKYVHVAKVNIARSIKLRSEKSGASGGETTGG